VIPYSRFEALKKLPGPFEFPMKPPTTRAAR
jgi:hypothetical protein